LDRTVVNFIVEKFIDINFYYAEFSCKNFCGYYSTCFQKNPLMVFFGGSYRVVDFYTEYIYGEFEKPAENFSRIKFSYSIFSTHRNFSAVNSIDKNFF